MKEDGKMHKRIKELRKTLGLTLENFGAKLGVKKSTLSLIENGKSTVTEQMFISICREYHVNEGWLRDGNGPMFDIIEDETAAVVSGLLEESNPLNDIIIGILKTYMQLDENSKMVLQKFSKHLLDNLA